MAFRWDEQRIGWYLDASAYGDFHARLARLIAPLLRPADTLRDLGCGLGRLSLALAPHVHSVTAVDTDAGVIEALRRDAGRLGLANLTARVADADGLGGRCDVVLMSFFGRDDDAFRRYLATAGRLLVRVVNADDGGHLYPGAHRRVVRCTTASLRALLDGAGLRYTLTETQLEFGQPLRSLQQAALFVRQHTPGVPQQELDDFLAAHLVPTHRADFPLYLPNPKRMGVFAITPPGG